MYQVLRSASTSDQIAEDVLGGPNVKMLEPPENVSSGAHVKSLDEYRSMYAESLADPDAFWAQIAKDYYWKKAWSNPVCSYNFNVNDGPIFVEWFKDAETNICYNAVDRHVEDGNGDRVAFLWEGNDVGQDSQMTYKEVLDKVSQCANFLKRSGVKKGDDVTIYMPMTPELPITMLACARIGAVHSVVFGGFSAESLSNRILDSTPNVVVTTSGVKRGSKTIELKKIVDDALSLTEAAGHKVATVLVHDHSIAIDRSSVSFVEGRDVWWQESIPGESTDCPVEWVGSEDPSFKLYTSGSTGKPKGVLHTTGGYMVGAGTTFKYVFDYHQGDVFWCTADCGWITGHSYITYGPMFHGATQVIFEGVPTYPDAGRCWDICDKYGVTQFYTAPTAIRSLMSQGPDIVKKYSRKSLRILGTVGEPINPEAWRWYSEVVGDGRCPIVDTWWQTETGAHMVTPLPGATPLKPGSATLPFFGVEPVVLDENGKELEGECDGILAMKRPWPSVMRTLAGDHQRFESTYFSPYKGYYFAGDGCRRDADGYIWITGRVDDIINVSGHRIGSAEVESALVAHPACSEAAVVPFPHDIKGEGIYAYITLMKEYSYPPPEDLKKELILAVRKAIGPIATPDCVHWAPGLPKTRSGKIMRRILRKIASKEESQLGDISTLADPSVVDSLIGMREF